MKLLNKFFNLHKGYRYHYGVAGIFAPFVAAANSAFVLWLVLYVALRGGRLSLEIQAIALVAAAILIVSLLRLSKPGRISKKRLKERQEAIEKLIQKGNLSDTQQKISPSATIKELYPSGVGVINTLSGAGWKFGDFMYVTGSLFFNNAISEVRYFSCMEIDLPRKLPAMLFLSKRSSHNFGFYFKKTQTEKAKLEANMEKYFDMYFPIHYHIDSIGIMSPEVIEVMLKLKDFDIEIRDDKLLLYGSLIENQSIQALIDTATEMANKLSDHVVFYIDERAENGSKEVSAVGNRLRESENRTLVFGLSSILFAVLAAYQWGLDESWLHKVAVLYLSVVLFAIGVAVCVSTVTAVKKHGEKLDKLQEEYEKKRDTRETKRR